MKKVLFKNNSALAGVIEALLLVGLVAVILSTIQLVYIPEIMKQKETSHLDEVENQFAQIKSVIDTQSMMGVMQSDEAIAFSPMYSPVNLGTKKLPYFVSSNTFGRISIYKNVDESYIDLGNNPTDYVDGIPLSSIKYEFLTMYLTYEPTYILEAGGIIYNQTGNKSETGEVMKVNPAINVDNSTNRITIYFSIPVFYSLPGKDNVQDIILTYIRTNYTTHTPYNKKLDPGDPSGVPYIQIYSNHLDAWYQAFTDDRIGIFSDYTNGYIDVEYKSSENPPYIEITPGQENKDIYIDFTIVDVGVQVGSGVVIS